MKIKELLSLCKQNAIFNIRPETPVQDVAKQLRQHNVGALLVTDANGAMRGVISERDLVRAFAEDTTISGLAARDLMTEKVISCSVDDDAIETMARLNELNIRHVPVLDEGQAAAMLSIRDFEHACKAMQSQATTDGLTGLTNRRAFDEKLHDEFALHQRFSAPMSIAFFDLDRFKSVNDTFGHAVGDEVLNGISRILEREIRSFDCLARVGGEEFAILFPHTRIEDATNAVQRIVETVAATPIPTTAGSLQVTISAGLSRSTVADTDGSEILLRADKLMYQAKDAGRNCMKDDSDEDMAVLQSGSWPAVIRVTSGAPGRA